MKKWIISKCLNYIEKNCNYTKEKLKEIEYGLITIYLTITKSIIILFMATVFGIFKESIIFMLFFSLIRSLSFGIHATKSSICWISSIIIFLIVPYISKYLIINNYLVQLICLVCVLLIFKYSPADTKKRPIVKINRRKLLKILSTLTALIYSCIAIYFNNNYITNCIIFSLILENILISPIVYKVFNLPYNNYIEFLKNHPNFLKS